MDSSQEAQAKDSSQEVRASSQDPQPMDASQEAPPGTPKTPTRDSSQDHVFTSPLPPTSPFPLTSPLPSPLDAARKRSRPTGATTPTSSEPNSQRRRTGTDGQDGAGAVPPSSEVGELSSPMTFVTASPGGSVRSAVTPHRRRTDLSGAGSRHREVALTTDGSDLGLSTDPAGATSEAGGGARVVIWGTDVVVTETYDQFKRFILQYAEEEEGDSFYMQRLEELAITEEPYLNVSSAHMQRFCPELYRQLVQYPQEVIPTFDQCINDIFGERFNEVTLQHQIQVRPYNVEKTTNMRALNPTDIDQLITICGMVIRTSNIIPEMTEAFFSCYVCQKTHTVEIDRGRIAEPAVCPNCETKYSMSIVHNRCVFTDKQMVKLQEAPEDMPAGETSHTVVLYAHDDLVDSVNPGDRVTVTGIYRATPVRMNPRQRSVNSVYKTHIDVIHFKKNDEHRLREVSDDDDGGKTVSFPPERVEELQELSKSNGLYERLANAIAPSIYENLDIKKGVLMQLFGGARKDFSKTGRGRFRSDLNILLCGDPGTSKSQLLQYVFNLVPRGQYTSGKGSSATGLTAYITRDPETKQVVLQTGALVLSDNGVCCIDEFDKMDDSTRAVLHEVMEQQTLSIAKAGIICVMNARASVLAAANPCDSRWNPKLTIVENIKLPHTLLSRFDLIFLMLDPQDESFDKRLATHLVSLYYRDSARVQRSESIDSEMLRDYIAYARTFINPRLNDEAGQKLIQEYVQMRKIGAGRGIITAYPRQLESLIRLSEAHARMRLSNVVEELDVNEANRLYKEALKQAATDPKTGQIDMEILMTGLSATSRAKRTELAKFIVQSLTAGKKSAKMGEMYDICREGFTDGFTQTQYEMAIRDLLEEGKIIQTSNRQIRLKDI